MRNVKKAHEKCYANMKGDNSKIKGDKIRAQLQQRDGFLSTKGWSPLQLHVAWQCMRDMKQEANLLCTDFYLIHQLLQRRIVVIVYG